MAEGDTLILDKINYYCRQQFYCHMEKAAAEGLTKYGNDSVLKYFKGFAILLQGRTQDGMCELELVKDKRDLNLCSVLALLFAHKRCKTIDREAIQELERKLKEERKQSGDMGLYYAGLFWYQVGRPEKAKEYTDRAFKLNDRNKQILTLKGWIELATAKDPQAKKAYKYFDEVMGMTSNCDMDATFGICHCLMVRHNFKKALEFINQLIVAFPELLPGLEQKIKLLLALKDWEQATDTAYRALELDQFCIEALCYLTLYNLCKVGDYTEAHNHLGKLVNSLDTFESSSKSIYYSIARLISRVCGRNELILQMTHTLAQRAIDEDCCEADYMRELGYQLVLSGKIKEALECYKHTIKLDETNLPAVTGTIECQLIQNKLDDAAQQLEFLNEIQMSIGKTSELYYLTAVLSRKRNKGQENVIVLLNEAIEKHFSALKNYYLGVDYYIMLNPDFLILIVKDYLNYAPQQPLQHGQAMDPVLRKCQQILETLLKAAPRLLEGIYLMGKVKFISGDFESAQMTLQHCLEQDQSLSDAHILMAQIHLHLNNFKLAAQSLEFGLSHNFQVREHPVYHLIRAQIQKKQNELTDAIQTLQYAMGLPGMKTSGSKTLVREKIHISVNDRVSVFLELADTHRLLGQQHEAAKVMQDAINEFQGSPEEVRITIANVDLALARGDVELALKTLRNVSPEQQYFVHAREKMANIYLNYRNDKRLYANCYRELVEKKPSVHTSLLLGDAYMNIQEPESAIEIYESALRLNPKDTTLASKIGKALVKTHEYGKAVIYYEAALKAGGQSILGIDLAKLLLRLKQHEKAEKILKKILEQDVKYTDLDAMEEQAKCLHLLAKIFQQTNRTDDALLFFTKAKEMQIRAYQRVQTEQPDAVSVQRQMIVKLCCEMAQHAMTYSDYDRAVVSYKEALTYGEGDSRAMLELAKVYLAAGDLDSCRGQCILLLNKDKENDDAMIMLADLCFSRNDYENSLKYYKQLLTNKPDNYEVLAKLVDLLRRSGNLEDVADYLETAKEMSPYSKTDAGFNYCLGLYDWYTGRSTAALKCFNMARKDAVWGNRAIFKMVEICLNPDSVTIGGEVFESVEGQANMDKMKVDNEQVALRTASKLLKEIKPCNGNIRLQLMENMILVASKMKPNVEKALTNFMKIASIQKNNVGAMYGMATAYMVQKQVPKARNQLKPLSKINWTMEDAEDLEKSWLLLADIYIQSNKYDLSNELLKKCLKYNKSCCKAYEYSGFIMEKEQSYKDAANHYENAWKYGSKNNPVIGYKLAFNYLKAKRYIDAIDICHHVLASYPDFPKIRKEILNKARSNWKT